VLKKIVRMWRLLSAEEQLELIRVILKATGQVLKEQSKGADPFWAVGQYVQTEIAQY
jgi:hypothetical protein